MTPRARSLGLLLLCTMIGCGDRGTSDPVDAGREAAADAAGLPAPPTDAGGDAPGIAPDAPTCADSCGACCVAGECQPISESYCPVGPGTCQECGPEELCRFGTASFRCVTPLADGEPCTFAFECRGEVCSQGTCQTACAPTMGVCYGDQPCCDPLATCAPPPVPGASRTCCAPAGTTVGATVADCSRCCFGLSCGSGPWGGSYVCTE